MSEEKENQQWFISLALFLVSAQVRYLDFFFFLIYLMLKMTPSFEYNHTWIEPADWFELGAHFTEHINNPARH